MTVEFIEAIDFIVVIDLWNYLTFNNNVDRKRNLGDMLTSSQIS